MFKIINFKELIYQEGAFFDSVSIFLRIGGLVISICSFKSSQFSQLKSRLGFSNKIGIRIKLPHQCKNLQMILHPTIVNMSTQAHSYSIEVGDYNNQSRILFETDLGDFICYAVQEEEKFVTQIGHCAHTDTQQFINDSSQNLEESSEQQKNGWEVIERRKMGELMGNEMQKTVKMKNK